MVDDFREGRVNEQTFGKIVKMFTSSDVAIFCIEITMRICFIIGVQTNSNGHRMKHLRSLLPRIHFSSRLLLRCSFDVPIEKSTRPLPHRTKITTTKYHTHLNTSLKSCDSIASPPSRSSPSQQPLHFLPPHKMPQKHAPLPRQPFPLPSAFPRNSRFAPDKPQRNPPARTAVSTNAFVVKRGPLSYH